MATKSKKDKLQKETEKPDKVEEKVVDEKEEAGKEVQKEETEAVESKEDVSVEDKVEDKKPKSEPIAKSEPGEVENSIASLEASSPKAASVEEKKTEVSSEKVDANVASEADKLPKKSWLSRLSIKRNKGDKKQEPVDNDENKSSDELAEDIYKKIAEVKGSEYVMIRIRKRTLLLAGGLILLIMWLIPLSKWALSFVDYEFSFWPLAPVVKVETEQVVTEEIIEVNGIKIRVRDNGSEEGAAQELADFLTQKGYPYVEVVDDHNSDYSGVAVVLKPGVVELRNELEGRLRERYSVSSPSAELTEDSDFDAVVLFGLKTVSEVSDTEAATDSAEVK